MPQQRLQLASQRSQRIHLDLPQDHHPHCHRHFSPVSILISFFFLVLSKNQLLVLCSAERIFKIFSLSFIAPRITKIQSFSTRLANDWLARATPTQKTKTGKKHKRKKRVPEAFQRWFFLTCSPFDILRMHPTL